MATYYWIGGNGTWDNTNTLNWSLTSGGLPGVAVPTSADIVNFDSASGTGTCTTAATAAAATVTLNSSTLGLTLGAGLTISGTFTLTLGTLSLGSSTLTCNIFSSNNSNSRTIAFGTGAISVAGSGATVWNTTTVTNFAITGTPTVNFTYSGSTGTRTIASGTLAENQAFNINVTAGTDIIVGPTVAKNLNFTGFSGSASNGSKTLYGNLIVSTGMTVTAGTAVLNFSATSGTQQITSNGKTLDFPLVFNGVGGSWQLVDNLTTGSTRTVTLTNGTLDLNSKTLSCGLFSSSNSNTRSIAFGTGNITLTGSGATIWSTSTVTGFTLTGTPTVNCTYAGSTGTRTISTSTAFTETNVPNFNVSAGGDTVDFGTSARRVGSVNFTGFSGTLSNFYVVSYGNLTFSSGMTLTDSANITQLSGTGTQTITSNGKTIPFNLTVPSGTEAGTRIFADALAIGTGRYLTMRGTVKFTAGTTNTAPNFYFSGSSTNQLYVQSTVSGTQYTLSQASGTVSAVYSTIKDCVATGGATWNAYRNLGNIDAGNNIGWDFLSTPVTTTTLAMRLGFGL